MSEQMTAAAPASAAPATYMVDAQGRLVPVSTIRPEDLLIDQTVAKIIGFAKPLADQVGRFKGHCFDDVGAMMELLAERYGSSVGGRKGNMTLTSFDGLKKVTVQVADTLVFGPELQIAKGLVDRCIEKWASDVNDHIRVLVNHAFQVDKEGKINHAALFQLRRAQIDDPDWQNAMAALTDSIRIAGSKSYIRFYERASTDASWKPIVIDLAAA